MTRHGAYGLQGMPQGNIGQGIDVSQLRRTYHDAERDSGSDAA